MGDLVGAFVELAVGQDVVLEAQRNGIGLGSGVGFDLLVDQLGVGVMRGAMIQSVQQMVAFSVRQDVQAAERHIRSLFKGVGQAFQGRMQITRNPLRANGRIDHHGQGEVFTQVIDVQRQRVIGALLGAQHLDAVGDFDHRRHVGGGAVTVVEYRAEQRRRRRHAAAPLCQRQGRMFVIEQAREALMGDLDRSAHALLTHIHPQWQGVDEHAQGPLTALACAHAPEHHGAKYHRLPPGNRTQHSRQGQVHQARHTHPQRARHAAQAAAQSAVDGDAHFVDPLAIALHILQAERQGRFIDIRQHVAEERLMGLLADAMAHLGDIAAKRYRCRGLGLLPGQVQLDFMPNAIQGRVIKDGVVEQQHRHHPLVGRVVSEYQAQQRRLAQVHAISAGIIASEQLSQAVSTVQLRLFAGQHSLAPHHLQRFVQALPDHRSAQNVVTVDDPLQRLGKGLKACAAVEHELRVQHVRVTLLRREVVIEHTFLKRRQRVDILHIRRTAWDRRDDAVDGRLVEVDQGQHVRCDAVGRAQPVTAMFGDQLQQLGFVRDQLIPERVVQRFVIAQDDQVALFGLQTDRMGGDRCQ